MKCPGCGEELKKDYLYCEKCGEEIRIVPDFEPEIENSIIETLSAVAEEMVPELEEEQSATDDLDSDFIEEPKHSMQKNISLAVIVFCIFCLGIFVFFFARDLYLENYYKVQVENAKAEFDRKNYEAAVVYYENALDMEADNSMLINYADCLYQIGKKDQALTNYYAVIEQEPENNLAYARIISIYEKEGNYAEINRLLSGAESQTLQNQFQNYMVFEPTFSQESGTYNQVVPLKIQAPATGTIYYTLDGSNPLTNGIEYAAPIFLRFGEYHIKAVYVNDFDLTSTIVEAKYVVEGTRPELPQITPESGQFNVPQLITVTVPPGCSVYYTTDGSMPDETCSIYGEPIPMKEGVSNYRFVALSAEGVYSEVVARSYQLAVETTLTAEDSVYRLKYRLIEKNRILDLEGNLANMSGKNIYVYNSLRIVQDKIFHVIYEYYQEGNNSRNMTGNIYGVDVSNGYVYKIIKDENGIETLEPI